MNQSRNELLGFATTCWFAIAAGSGLSSCANTSEAKSIAEAGLDKSVGQGERSFIESYAPELHLPVSEQAFLAVVKKLGFRYELFAEKGGGASMPKPRSEAEGSKYDFAKCYQIYGKVDRVKRIGEIYRAFVDSSEQVVLVENAFAYTGP